MRRHGIVTGLAALVAGVVIAVVIASCGGSSHKATCWTPAFAKAHQAPGATYIHRHGKGALNVNVCDPK